MEITYRDNFLVNINREKYYFFIHGEIIKKQIWCLLMIYLLNDQSVVHKKYFSHLCTRDYNY